jgi:hypothetical protein
LRGSAERSVLSEDRHGGKKGTSSGRILRMDRIGMGDRGGIHCSFGSQRTVFEGLVRAVGEEESRTREMGEAGGIRRAEPRERTPLEGLARAVGKEGEKWGRERRL